MRLEEEAAQRHRVLVVDDEPGVARALVRALSLVGIIAEACHDASTALEKTERGEVDAIVTDVHLGDVSGIELLRAIRLIEPSLPVVLISGQATLDTALQAVELAAVRYLRKPVAPEMLVGVVRQALRQRDLQALALSEELGDDDGLEESFDRALTPLWIAYQPIFRVATKEVYGYEALVRTDEPSFSTPMALLSAARKLDREDELYRAIRRSIARTADRLPPNVRLFVNLSLRELIDDDLVDARAPLAPYAGRVVYEVSGRIPLENYELLHDRADRLRRLGYRLAVDDVGEGHASMLRIAELEPDYLKLDRAMSRAIHASARRRRFLETLLGITSKLMIEPIATGIERKEERDAFLELGCFLQQGFHFARPGRPLTPPENARAASSELQSVEGPPTDRDVFPPDDD